MKIIKYKKKNANQYTITLSDNTSLSFYDDTIIYYNLLGKKEIEEKLLKEIVEYNQNFEAYYKALKQITVKLRTEKEIKDKLKKENYSNENIEFALDKLKNQGYINNDLYLRSYIADQINLSLKGPKKIEQDLKKIGFSETDIDNYLNSYDESVWKERIEKIIEKKIKANHNLSLLMLKNKIKKDLMNLGYTMNLIEESLSNTYIEENDEALKKEFNKAFIRLSKKYKNTELKLKIKYYLYKKGFPMDLIEQIINKEM